MNRDRQNELAPLLSRLGKWPEPRQSWSDLNEFFTPCKGAGWAILALFTTLAPAQTLDVLHVRPNIYMLASPQGNVTLQLGDHPGHDGVLLVDTGSVQMSATMLAEIRKLSTKPILFIINTSADLDHTGGNEAVTKPAATPRAVNAAPAVAVYAHDNVLQRLSKPGSGVPEEAWPSLTFEDGKDFIFNGEPVQMIAEKAAHTDGDSVVFFRGSNVISTGNIFRTTGYPMIDLQRGGSIQGEVKALNHLLDLAVSGPMQEGGTMIIPGQGRLCDEADVTEYRDMITIIRDRVADMLKKGKTLEEAKAARLTRDYDGRFSTAAYTGDMFVEAVYRSLAAEGSKKK